MKSWGQTTNREVTKPESCDEAKDPDHTAMRAIRILFALFRSLQIFSG